MKKLLALLLALAMCFAMFACGGEEKDSKKDKDEDEIAELKDEIEALEDEIADLEEEIEDADEDEVEDLEEELEEKKDELKKLKKDLKKLESDDEEDEDEEETEEEDEDETEEEPEEETEEAVIITVEATTEAVTTEYYWGEATVAATTAVATTGYYYWDEPAETTEAPAWADAPEYTYAYTEEATAEAPAEYDPDAICYTLDDAIAKLKFELDVMASGDIEEFAALSGTDLSALDPISSGLIVAMLDCFEYEMGNVAGDSTNGSVTVTITSMNTMEVATAMYTAIGNGGSEEEMMAAALAVLESNLPTFTETVTVYFEKVDGEWIMSEDNYAFQSVVAGMPTE